MTLEGVPLNEPEDQGVYFSNYPDFFNSLSSVQFQRGVGLNQQGAASYAGSIQFEAPLLQEKARKELSVGYGSFQSYRISGELHTGMKKTHQPVHTSLSRTLRWIQRPVGAQR